MLRRVHSIWNHVARSIYPEFTNDIPGVQSLEEGNTWRSTFYREREKAQDRIRSRREQIDPVFTPTVRIIVEILRIYPATLDIQVEAMTTLQWRISHINKQDNYELEHFAGRAYVNTLYSALSRHILRPNPYAAHDLNSQIQEHTAVTPRATRVFCHGALTIDSLENLNHRCPTAIPILLNSLRVLTAGRIPRKILGQDWKLTNQAAYILLMNLRRMYSEDLTKLGGNTLETLKIFVQSHLISQERLMDEKKGLCSLECCPRIAKYESLRYYQRTPQNQK